MLESMPDGVFLLGSVTARCGLHPYLQLVQQGWYLLFHVRRGSAQLAFRDDGDAVPAHFNYAAKLEELARDVPGTIPVFKVVRVAHAEDEQVVSRDSLEIGFS